jgi:hypothetical protein
MSAIPREFAVDINLNGNALQYAIIHPLATAPTSPTPKEGQIYYNSTDKTIYQYNGTAWVGMFIRVASETALGIVELANSTEIAAGTDLNGSNPLVVTPSKMKTAIETATPLASETVTGRIQWATTAQANVGTDTETGGDPLAVKPSQLKAVADASKSLATETAIGVVELATDAQATAGTNTEGGNPLVVKPSQLKAGLDAAKSLGVGGDLSGTLPNPVVEQSTSTDGFLIKVGTYETRLKPIATSGLALRNTGDSAYADLTTKDVHITGDLTVDGVVKQVSTETIQLEDSILVLNNNEAGAPSQNAGLEVERGTSVNASLLWNETDDDWEVSNGANTHKLARIKSFTITGDGTAVDFVCTHNFGTKNVIAQVYNSTDYQIETCVKRTSTTATTISFNTAPAVGATYTVTLGA